MKKFLIMIILLSLLSFSTPQKSYAQYVDVPNATKEYGLDGLAYVVAQTTLRKLTAKTVNWINNGFKGNPGYITDPEKFFLNIGDDIASQFLSQPGINRLCTPFAAGVRAALVKNYIDDTRNYSCSLSILQNNYQNFMNDFTQGGLDAWFELTQIPQNNPYGAFENAQKELSIQVDVGQKKIQKEIDLSGGFLNLKRCPKGASVIDPVSLKPICTVEEESVTPGTVISDQIKESLGTKWGSLVSADEFNEIITALVSQLITQVAGSASGLLGASEPNYQQGSPLSLVDSIANEPQPYVNYGPISATQPSLNCTSTGGGTDQFGNTTGGTTDCQSSPGTITGAPTWPFGNGGTSGSNSCPAYTPDPNTDCTRVDSGTVLGILNNYPATNAGITAAMGQIQAVYPSATLLNHPIRLDKIDFGNGMVVDVMVGAGGPNASYGWIVECACNRNPSGSSNPNPPPPIPGVGTYLLTLDVIGAGAVTDNVDTCTNISGATTVTCSKPYPKDSYVSITVIPAVGKTFAGWGGACAVFGTSNTCYGNITGNGTVSATFR